MVSQMQPSPHRAQCPKLLCVRVPSWKLLLLTGSSCNRQPAISPYTASAIRSDHMLRFHWTRLTIILLCCLQCQCWANLESTWMTSSWMAWICQMSTQVRNLSPLVDCGQTGVQSCDCWSPRGSCKTSQCAARFFAGHDSSHALSVANYLPLCMADATMCLLQYRHSHHQDACNLFWFVSFRCQDWRWVQMGRSC